MSYTVSGGPIPPGSVAAELVGVAPATLQLWLTAAQTALHNLTIGGSAQTVTYGEAGSTKSVQYTRANIPALRSYILDLQRALGQVSPRHAMGVRFGRGCWGGGIR